ncbi:uncharacterized protein LOC114929767 [Nylanderia fulva]|uniref:uncharacterized protein LOC114927944 n=1 Tax=Nylanderia fulva TaxID=613905 RepID=UPI0010FB052F|nr:uncharacterized protein LOC114927944 [Nylanderia fulva]XP_029157259.1 uncharacterized protein LOC114929767 [Nylanderia fulva]
MKGDTAEELSRIHNAVTAAVNAQESIGRPINSHGMDLFNHLVVELFDARTRLEWESTTSDSTEPPQNEALLDFISRRVLTLNAARPRSVTKGPGETSRFAKAHVTKHQGADSPHCALCRENHTLMTCKSFKAKTAVERKTFVETNRLCFNCLGNHFLARCQSKKNCLTCNARHHTMLHGASTSTPSAEATSLATTLVTARQAKTHKAALLATARVKVADRYGSPHEVRVLIDQCSEVSIISEALAQRLRLPRASTDLSIFGIGGTRSGSARGKVTIDITSDVTNAELRVVAFVLPRISLQQGTAQREDRSWPHIHGLRLADPRFLDDDPAELLLGAEEREPVAGTPLTADEARCEDFYVRTVTRTSSGRYMVRLPCTSPPPTSLSETRRPAERLLEAMERKGARDPRFGDLYRDFMEEYENLQHMERTRSGESLNAHLLTGANLLPTLADVLLRWRWHRYVLVTDIEKMYRQILVHPEDRRLQTILWRHTSSDDVHEYELRTVTYGLACAPFLAIRTLHQLAADEEARYPRGVKALRHDCYVDDVVTGADSLEDAIDLQQELRSLCMVLTGVPPEHRHQRKPHSWEGESHATLGLRWHPQGDWFSFTIRPRAITDFTKRRVLAETARLFDPMGWLAPVVIRAKILIQTTWLQRLDWDSPLPDQDAHRWRQLLNQLPLLDDIRITRWLNTGTDHSQLQLHGFADASERGYAAVVYIRNAATEKTSINLLMAKSKVAPVKQVSLPRLELCAAALLTTLMLHVRSTLGLTTTPVHLWSDSKVTLHWIQGHSTRWKTFVANRVSQIQTLLPDAQWRHIAGRENPADCASRGVTPDELIKHKLWWTGPTWLSGDETAWPCSVIEAAEDDLPEQRATSLVVKAPITAEPDLLLRFPTLQRLLRVTAWCRRWLNPARRDVILGRTLHPDELDVALFRWLRVVQALHFPTDVAAASAGRTSPPRSHLARLSPVLDDQGVLRVGGRLKHAQLPLDERHPMIIPAASWLTRLVIDSCHRRTLHGGVQLTLGLLRLRFWVPRGRTTVKQQLHRCVTCTRWRAATPQPPMGNLPRDRVTPTRPFLSTGLDYAGPILLRTSKGRGHRAHKGYIAVFVCFWSKAIHLEVVSDYTSEAFIAALRRFISRRAAPHFGGLWEAAVKSTKFHLRRVIGETTLTFEELSTLLAQIEACLNSRPLQALSDDPEDVSALTPGHFLVGAPLLALPEPSLTEQTVSTLSRWRHLQRMRDHFWQRWSSEYVHGLAPRTKWLKDAPAPHVGDLCLVRSEITPPSRWPLARILRLHPGDDGITRVVTIRTATSELVRPLVKLVFLPGVNDAPTPHIDT